MDEQLQSLEQARHRMVEMGAEYAPRLFTALVILLAGYFVARWLISLLSRKLDKVDMEPPVRALIVQVVRVILLGVFLIIALSQMKVEVMPLIAGLGVAGAGIALAMQGVLGNLAAGLTIILTRPFRVGEYVSMVGVEGRVAEVKLFSTILDHPDRSRVVIPNRHIVGEIMHNYGTIRQLDVVVGVAYATDLNQALASVNRVLLGNSRVLQDPAPVVRVAMLADSSINIVIRPWVSVPDFGVASGEINKAVVEAFRADGISIPFPQREVRLLNQAG